MVDGRKEQTRDEGAREERKRRRGARDGWKRDWTDSANNALVTQKKRKENFDGQPSETRCRDVVVVLPSGLIKQIDRRTSNMRARCVAIDC